MPARTTRTGTASFHPEGSDGATRSSHAKDHSAATAAAGCAPGAVAVQPTRVHHRGTEPAGVHRVFD
jgi:hypothetical protein